MTTQYRTCRRLLPSAILLAMLAPRAAAATVPATDAVGKYPATEAFGDFNGDGILDKAAGFPHYNDNRGMVAVFFGSPSPSPTELVFNGSSYDTLDDTLNTAGDGMFRVAADNVAIFTPAGLNEYFGSSVVVADFDLDGNDDLVFGVPGATRGGAARTGAIYILSGEKLSEMKLGQAQAAVQIDQSAPGIGSAAEANDYFGEFLVSGDFNCDSYPDLAVGTPREDYGTTVDAGAVYVLYGSYQGLRTEDSTVLHQAVSGVADDPEAYDRFGGALAAGHFSYEPFGLTQSNRCDALAVGVPGEDIVFGGGNVADAGAVAVFYPDAPSGGIFNGYNPIGSGGAQFWHQGTAGLYSDPEAGDRFGARLAPFDYLGLEALWIDVPGEDHADCDAEGLHHALLPAASGLTSDDTLECDRTRPDLFEDERGRIVAKSDRYGQYLQYVPENIDLGTARLMVMLHGSNILGFGGHEADSLSAGFNNANKYIARNGWIAAAEEENLILLSIATDNWNFGNLMEEQPGVGGGYRALFGRDIDFDAWLAMIADRYERGGAGDGRFFLYGHSAGGQAASAFTVTRPGRLLGVVVESAGSHVFPDKTVPWRGGLGALELVGTPWGDLAHYPSLASFQTAVGTLDIFVAVGEDDEDPSRVALAQSWVATVNDQYSGDATLCVVPGVGHSSQEMYPNSVKLLFPDISWGSDADCL
jgi:pimeloyl-ACP methyl ester carboxylesterase